MPATIKFGKTEKRRDRQGRAFFHTPMIVTRGPLVLRDQVLTDVAGTAEYRFTAQKATMCRALLLRQGVLGVHDLVEYMWPDVDDMPDWYERSISVNLWYVRKGLKLFGFKIRRRYAMGVEIVHEQLSDKWDTPEGLLRLDRDRRPGADDPPREPAELEPAL